MSALLTQPHTTAAAVDPSRPAEPSPGTPEQRTTPAGRFTALANLAARAGWKSLAVVLFLALWEFGPTFLAAPATRVFLPPLHEVLAAGARLVEAGQLQSHLQASLTRSVSGFTI